MYLAPIESAMVLSTLETATRNHKSVQIPNRRKLIGSVSDNRVPDRNLDTFPKFGEGCDPLLRRSPGKQLISFFRFSLKLRSFLSFFFFRFSIMCRRVFYKTIILLGLAGYEMIITNSALRASLVIYHFISSAPS